MSELTFREEDHSYWMGGRRIPSVTQILRDTGLVDTRWFNETARIRGTAVHLACALEAKQELDWDSLHPDIVPYVDQYEMFLGDSAWVPIAVEQVVGDEQYAGTYDQILLNRNTGKYILIDIKTGSVPPWVGLQTIAYQRKITGIHISGRACLALTPNAYKLHMLEDPDDRSDWITVYNFYQIKKQLTPSVTQ